MNRSSAARAMRSRVASTASARACIRYVRVSVFIGAMLKLTLSATQVKYCPRTRPDPHAGQRPARDRWGANAPARGRGWRGVQQAGRGRVLAVRGGAVDDVGLGARVGAPVVVGLVGDVAGV